jgi:hypothetical protein
MKNKIHFKLLLPVVAVMFLSFTAFINYPTTPVKPQNTGDNLTIPDDVNAILDKTCFGCHNTESQSDKAKKKLLLDELPGLSKAKIVAKLDDIHSVVEKNEMPPEKFLEKYPDKKLTDAESTRLIEWAKNAAEEMLK